MSGAVGTLSREDQLTMDRGVMTMSADVREELPIAEEHGDEAVWIILDRNGARHEIDGMFLGMGSSHRPYHKGHQGAEWAPPRVHCSTCRWTELRIFRSRDDRLYVVNCGASDVPGERDFITVTEVGAPFELVETLTVTDRGSDRPMLPMPARRALAQAASHDAGLRDAYINSPVT
jgi:hypothetical protein